MSGVSGVGRQISGSNSFTASDNEGVSLTSFVPIDIYENIFQNLDSIQDLSTIRAVCKDWKLVLDDPQLMNRIWKKLFDAEFYFERCHIPPIRNDLKESYQKCHLNRLSFYSNLEKGNYSKSSIALDSFPLSIAFSNGNLVTKCPDNTIKIWDMKNGKCLTTLGIKPSVDSDMARLINDTLFCFDGKIAAGTPADGKIYIWDAKTYALIKILEEQKSPISCFAAAEGKLIAASEDKITIFDCETWECLHILKGQDFLLGCLAVADGKIISAARKRIGDTRITFFDLKTGTSIQSLQFTEEGEKGDWWIDDFFVAQGKLVLTLSHPSDCWISMIDLKSYTSNEIPPEAEIYSCKCSSNKENLLICGNDALSVINLNKVGDCDSSFRMIPIPEGFVYDYATLGNKVILAPTTSTFEDCNAAITIWDIDTGKCVNSFPANPYSKVAVTEGMIVSYSLYETEIEIWDFLSGNSFHK